MALENECDITLRYLDSMLENIAETGLAQSALVPIEELYHQLVDAKKIKVTFGEFTRVMAILGSNDHVLTIDQKFAIKKEGVVFIHTSSYADRKEGWDLEREMKKQQINLNNAELLIKRYYYWVVIIGFMFSAFSLYNSCTSKKMTESRDKCSCLRRVSAFRGTLRDLPAGSYQKVVRKRIKGHLHIKLSRNYSV